MINGKTKNKFCLIYTMVDSIVFVFECFVIIQANSGSLTEVNGYGSSCFASSQFNNDDMGRISPSNYSIVASRKRNFFWRRIQIHGLTQQKLCCHHFRKTLFINISFFVWEHFYE